MVDIEGGGLAGDAEALVVRSGHGQLCTVVVDGRPVAELGPVRRQVGWRTWDEISGIADLPACRWQISR